MSTMNLVLGVASIAAGLTLIAPRKQIAGRRMAVARLLLGFLLTANGILQIIFALSG